MALYAPDCVLESPLVRHLLGAELGIVEGREKLREFVRIVFERQPAARQRYREGFFTDGHKLMWEYPRSRPGGEQMDFVEVMEIERPKAPCRYRSTAKAAFLALSGQMIPI